MKVATKRMANDNSFMMFLNQGPAFKLRLIRLS